MIFEITNGLKILILPSIGKSLIFRMTFYSYFILTSFLLYEKFISKIFKLFKTSPFQTFNSCHSHFEVLGFNTDTFENLSKTFKTSITDFWFFRENIESLAYAVYINSYLKIFRPFILLLDLVTGSTISKTKMKI